MNHKLSHVITEILWSNTLTEIFAKKPCQKTFAVIQVRWVAWSRCHRSLNPWDSQLLWMSETCLAKLSLNVKKIIATQPSLVSIRYPPATNIAPENGWLEDEISFWEGLFSGNMLVSGRVSTWIIVYHLVSLKKPKAITCTSRSVEVSAGDCQACNIFA